MAVYFTLRELLQQRGITERQFAHEQNIREGTLYEVCNSQIKRLPVEVVEKVCNALQVQPGDWIKYRGSNKMDKV